jgi:hypothetical protein
MSLAAKAMNAESFADISWREAVQREIKGKTPNEVAEKSDQAETD